MPSDANADPRSSANAEHRCRTPTAEQPQNRPPERTPDRRSRRPKPAARPPASRAPPARRSPAAAAAQAAQPGAGAGAKPPAAGPAKPAAPAKPGAGASRPRQAGRRRQAGLRRSKPAPARGRRQAVGGRTTRPGPDRPRLPRRGPALGDPRGSQEHRHEPLGQVAVEPRPDQRGPAAPGARPSSSACKVVNLEETQAHARGDRARSPRRWPASTRWCRSSLTRTRR